MSAVLEKGLYSKLTGASPQTLAVERVYPRLPQGVTFPAIRYQRVATLRKHALDGAVGVTEATMQVDCMAQSYSQAKTLADSVRTLLHGYTGAWSTLTIRHLSLDTENDFSEQDGDRVTHWVTQRYRIWSDMD
ncbi:MAG: DUF3168 domain-containing protein [Acidiferrobacterales bacterium]